VVIYSSRRSKEFERRDKELNADAHFAATLLRRYFAKWRETPNRRRSPKRKRGATDSDDGSTDSVKPPASDSDTAPPSKRRRSSAAKNFGGRTGLRNLGNTCYFNSSVQCLNSTDSFRILFLNLPRWVDPESANVAPLPSTPDPAAKRRRRRRTRESPPTATAPSKCRASSAGRRRSARLRAKSRSVAESESDDDLEVIAMESVDTAASSDSNAPNECSASSASNDSNPSPSGHPEASPVMGPSPALLRRRTSVLLSAMENAEELEEGHPVSLSAEVYSLLRLFDSGKYKIVTPHRLAYSIWNTVPQFRSYSQHDAQEFVNLFLDRLQLETQSLDDDDDDGDDDGAAAVHRQRPSEYLRQSFDCRLVSVTECLSCGNQSDYRPPGNKCISLDIYGTIRRLLLRKKEDLEREEAANQEMQRSTKRTRRRRRSRTLRYNDCAELTLRHLATDYAFNRALKSYALCSLSDLLETAMKSPVVFSGENQYFCSRCDQKVDAVKRECFESLGNVLIFHLCRAYYNVQSGKREKLQNKLGFPLTLRMDSFVLNADDDDDDDGDGELVYDLVAALVHSGRSMNRGHYIAYCRHKETERWLKFDDVRVTVTTEKKVLESNVYLLFYERQNVRSQLDEFLRDFPGI